MTPPRRCALAALVTCSALAAGCPAPPPARDAGDGGAAALDAGGDAVVAADAPVDRGPPLRPPPIQRTQPDSELEARRRACAFDRGAWPAQTLGTDVPIGDEIPIDHVLVLMMENRSFDHYFGRLREAGATDVETPPADWSNPRANGAPAPAYRDTEYCIRDPAHGWDATHAQYNNGMVNGFVTTNDPGGERAMGYMAPADLAFYYGLATTFAIGDHYFCSVLGPTFPNRMYVMSATSFGRVSNVLIAEDTREAPVDSIFRRFDDAQLEWRDYAAGARMIAVYPYYGVFRRETRAHLYRINDLMAHLASGNLPPFAFIEPDYVGNGGDRVDEHPPGMPQSGEAWVEPIVRALMASPAWRRTALFITYDEHGGFADHVAPPAACEPDALAPRHTDGRPAQGRFDRLGFRVPFIVVSPYARRGFVSHRVYDHASILRFVEARFGLPAMTRRDANATPPTEMFDFRNPPFMTPPTIPASRVDPAARERCRAAFPGG